jgi:hypothetical protein
MGLVLMLKSINFRTELEHQKVSRRSELFLTDAAVFTLISHVRGNSPPRSCDLQLATYVSLQCTVVFIIYGLKMICNCMVWSGDIKIIVCALYYITSFPFYKIIGTNGHSGVYRRTSGNPL